MKQEIKYTTDGKKVVIVGSLNSQEKIVQEIFIVNDCEIPSGENFVVKSLHDVPAISWKEKELKRIDAEYETTKFRNDNELKVLNARFKTISCELSNKIGYAGKVLKNISPDSFNTLVDYLTGEIKYIVKIGYSPELIEWKDFIQTYEDKLLLISIYGNDDGNLTYAVGDYYEFSGGHKHFKPFNNYEDAFEFFTNQLLTCTISDEVIKKADAHNVKLDDVKLKEFKAKKTKELTANIENYQKAINTWNEQINTLTT